MPVVELNAADIDFIIPGRAVSAECVRVSVDFWGRISHYQPLLQPAC